MNNEFCPYTCCTVNNTDNCKCTENRMLGSIRAIPAFQADQETLYEALRTLIFRIKACGASLAITHASSLACDLLRAIGNKYNPANPYAADRVREAIDEDHGATQGGTKRDALLAAAQAAIESRDSQIYRLNCELSTVRNDLARHVKELAAARDEAERLHAGVEAYLKEYDPENFGCACEPDYECGTCRMRTRHAPLQQLVAARSAEQQHTEEKE